MRLRCGSFGSLPDGRCAGLFTLENAAGMSVTLTDFGARVVRLLVPDAKGRLRDVALGQDSLKAYLEDEQYFGAVCGRVANRISGAAFRLGGTVHRLPRQAGGHTLHGGPNGFHRRLWRCEILEDGLRFIYDSADGEEGFPGALRVSAAYRLGEDNRLCIAYEAAADADTPVNLTNHCYFNLAGHDCGDVLAQELMIPADFYTPVDEALLPTGEVLSVADTPFDFRVSKPIGRDIGLPHPQLLCGGGYDHNFVLRKSEREALTLAARAADPAGGLALEVWTTAPGLQLYTANGLRSVAGKDGALYGPRAAFCLETQYFPDSLRHTHFPSPVLRAGERRVCGTEFRFIS
ncbi:MAG: aldose epimerase family protein [Clostridia bacterium]|nr:aldose epimerase family protein [Clostridia bacterium]